MQRLALLSLLLLTTCAAKRGQLVPRVDHHQHIVSSRALIPAPARLPAIVLPAELAGVLERRNGKDVDELYVAEPQIVDSDAEAEPWVRGREAVKRVVASHDGRFVPTAFALDGSAAWISGHVDTREMNFFLGLRKEDGAWRIASEFATPAPPRNFARGAALRDGVEDEGAQAPLRQLARGRHESRAPRESERGLSHGERART
ncbi:MAG TPA: hypothetical protein VEK11_11380, partial [Thermoanaerobaculia bacterium]|nr:hypothetical protein [Thermoanaerobaculia bacterium]